MLIFYSYLFPAGVCKIFLYLFKLIKYKFFVKYLLLMLIYCHVALFLLFFHYFSHLVPCFLICCMISDCRLHIVLETLYVENL